ncbi:MAG: hypothetical protein ACYTKD_04320 [Planctomycetota bacterium]
MPDVVDIAEESKKYPNEWVLFVITKIDGNHRAVKGRLLCHSGSRDEIHEVAMRHRGEGLGLKTDFIGDPVPADTYVVL